MTIIIVGNSHVGALHRGASQIDGALDKLKIAPFGGGKHQRTAFSVEKKGRVEFSDKYSRHILQDLTGRAYFDPEDVWGICMGTHNSPIYRDAFWRTAVPPGVPGPKKRPLSSAVLNEIILQHQVHILTFLKQLKQNGLRVFVVSSPNPRRDSTAANRGISLATIQTIDRAARRSFEEWLRAMDIPIINPPAETVDADGFLKDEFAQHVSPTGKPDGSHANADYGKLMVAKVLAELRALGLDG